MNERLIPIVVSHEHPGSEIEIGGDVWEFAQAMAAYQKRYRRRYPMWSEILYVLRTLGYAKRVPGASWQGSETRDQGSGNQAENPTT